MVWRFEMPVLEEQLLSVAAGDIVELSGVIFTARDAAHKRICDSLSRGERLPFELFGAAIYYTGPTPARAGEVIGSCGPTTSSRMDDYTPMLLNAGLKIMIGKGGRSDEVVKSIIKNRAIYLVAIGGAAAIIKDSVKSCHVVAFEELGCEAVHQLRVERLQLIVAINAKGDTIFAR